MNTKSIGISIIAISVLIGTVTFTSTVQGVHADPKRCAGNPHNAVSGSSGNPHVFGDVGNPHDSIDRFGHEVDNCPGAK